MLVAKEKFKQPINPEIARAAALYNTQIVNKAPIEHRLKTARALGHLTLAEIDAVAQRDKQTFAKAAKEQDTYSLKTFFYFPMCYVVYRKSLVEGSRENELYTPGTEAFKYREQYNTYCDAARPLIKGVEDPRFLNAIYKDESAEQFTNRSGFSVPT